MKVPFRLRRIAEARPATALLLPGHETAPLLAVCVRLGLESWPAVFAVHEGFLLRLEQPLTEPVPGLMRLAEVAKNVLVPVDADLVPGLLPDEAASLGRERGLVFLPHGGVLEFAPRQPVPLGQFLELGDPVRRSWQSLDQPSRLSDRLVSITLDRPDPPAEKIVEAGGEGIGVATPRPGDAPTVQKLAGSTAMGLGKALAWLGRTFNSKKLANLGGKMMAAGMNLVPRLTEKLLGKQEAGLRELLKYFQSGDVEKALRHAIPIRNDAPGGVVLGGTQLPTQDTRYSLAGILGGAGPAGAWFTRDEIFRQLEREYRRQAEAATKRGDYRRAAFIYGKLLGDFRMAAAVLGQGGLHHDAAIIYLNRLNDHLSAAREFEAAGEMDRALQLYRQKGEHVRAGDLLRRLGEEELALAEYKAAAEELVRARAHCRAGDLMLGTAGRPDLALEYFEAGWELRPDGAPVACANRLARLYAESGAPTPLLRLVGEAEEFFGPIGNESAAGDFFNYLAHVASEPRLDSVREELRDRALLGLANKLRQRSGAGAVLFTPGTVWETAVVSDAHVAAKASRTSGARLAAAAVSMTKLPVQSLATAVVTAVCHSPDSGELYLGFRTGEIARYDVQRGGVVFLEAQAGAVLGLAAGADGRTVVAHAQNSFGDYLVSLCQLGSNSSVDRCMLGPSSGTRWLCPMLNEWIGTALVWDSEAGGLRIFAGPRLLPREQIPTESYPKAALLPRNNDVLLFDGRAVTYLQAPLVAPRPWQHPCPFPALSQETSLAYGHAPLNWRPKGSGRVEIVGIGEGGTLGWLDMELHKSDQTVVSAFSIPGRFRAAALMRPGLIAGVTTDELVMLRATAEGISELTRQRISMPPPVACFANKPAGEVIVVTSDGTICRVAAQG